MGLIHVMQFHRAYFVGAGSSLTSGGAPLRCDGKEQGVGLSALTRLSFAEKPKIKNGLNR
ncbi:MAG: hypothetical protein M2R45_03858 [Verrucomicrobia subdivision 3 bacterium]|nr:hypothetical protein [Limisphaerales bacterium]MCS1415814.1 hypothetical protein [Limisphaerales bacterium]